MIAAQPLQQRIVVVPADRRPTVIVVIVVGHTIARLLLGCHAALMKRAGDRARTWGPPAATQAPARGGRTLPGLVQT